MTKTSDPKPVPRPAPFTEHRPQPAGASRTGKSAENAANAKPAAPAAAAKNSAPKAPKEIGGPKGPEPTRYGDWERDGRCVDF